MTEKEKIEYAKSFIDSLAEGKSPIDGSDIPDGEIIHNVRISRCFFFVSNVLAGVIESMDEENTVEVKSEPRLKKPQTVRITDEARAALSLGDFSSSGSDITDMINAVIDENVSAKLKRTTLNSWLLSNGFLEVTEVFGKNVKLPTELGREIGIYTEERSGTHGRYVAMLFGKSAKAFILDNLDSLIAYQNDSAKIPEEKTVVKTKPLWSPDDNNRLVELYRNGASYARIASELGKDEREVKDRLLRLGLV